MLVMPWAKLVTLIAAHAPVSKSGRPPFAIEIMLRIHCLQLWFGLSDLAAEEALFEMSIYREFVGLGGTNRIPAWFHQEQERRTRSRDALGQEGQPVAF